ncbi:MAG TPA: GNAT family protein [Methylomusa anaerophila]|uniref:Ribosomal-protein-serine acetyltransferase n=1 Tax=Methylomusa anaerophila TaxID=1930071 RepID=A0A348ALI2_9FIRM|nr:GNAT family protein [Methylomusa anaerophila]BBB91930.1 ribosomal-protein-serine acetyltransferase [Methylomusa anaerophila]HML88057.1 GNAT family protein [Methylomusa anaerophila]
MIEGKNINLRTVTENDLTELFALASRLREMGEFWSVLLPSEPNLKKEFAETGFWSKNFGKMLITDKTNTIIGEISYFKNAHYRCGYEIGYQLFREETRGKGTMTEALSLFSSYLFALYPIPRLQITCMAGNIASSRVAEKCGFKHEGTLRKATFNRGQYHDLELFSLLREECPSLGDVLKTL